MTSSGHVTSSVTYAIDSPWPNCYRLSIGTIPLSGFVSKIYLAPKLRKSLLRDDVISGRHLGFGATGNRSIRSAVSDNPTLGSNMKLIGHPFRRYGHLKFSKMAASRHLGFGATGSRSIRSAVPENPT